MVSALATRYFIAKVATFAAGRPDFGKEVANYLTPEVSNSPRISGFVAGTVCYHVSFSSYRTT